MNLSLDTLWEIIKDSPYEDIINLCRSHSHLFSLCHDPKVINLINRARAQDRATRVSKFLDYLRNSGMNLSTLFQAISLYDVDYYLAKQAFLKDNFARLTSLRMEWESIYSKIKYDYDYLERKNKKAEYDAMPDKILTEEFDEQYLLSHPYLIPQLVAETRKYPLYNKFRSQRRYQGQDQNSF